MAWRKSPQAFIDPQGSCKMLVKDNVAVIYGGGGAIGCAVAAPRLIWSCGRSASRKRAARSWSVGCRSRRSSCSRSSIRLAERHRYGREAHIGGEGLRRLAGQGPLRRVFRAVMALAQVAIMFLLATRTEPRSTWNVSALVAALTPPALRPAPTRLPPRFVHVRLISF
jgi:hypothetical protein